MKKSFILLLGLAVLAGCSQEEIGNEFGNGNENLAPIKLGAGVNIGTVSKSTRAVIASGTEFTAGIAGWETNGTVDYAKTTTWNTTITTTANATVPQIVNWTEEKFYNADAAVKTYMKAWYPEGTLTGSSVSFINTDGSVDVLFVENPVSGCKTDKDTKNLAFKHMTSQIIFKVVAGEGLATGTKVKSIKIKSAQLPDGFDLTKDFAEVVTYASAADLSVPGISEAEIKTDATTVGNPVMIKATGEATFKVDIETTNATYSDQIITIDNSGVMTAGSAYTITLTFKQAGIGGGDGESGLTATLTDWVPATGTGTIQ